MIKEIQEIAEGMISLNNSVYGIILSREDLDILGNNIMIMKSVQHDLNNLIDEASFSSTNIDQYIDILIKIHALLSQQLMVVEVIIQLMDKFIDNYRTEWEIIQKHSA